MTLTSQYAWLYNQYPFTNDPNAGLLHPDWWITECACVPSATTPTPDIAKPFRPNHFYDEQRLLLGKTYQAGDKVRLTVPAGSGRLDGHRPARLRAGRRAAVDLRRGERAAVRRRPDRPAGSADAFDKAIAFAQGTRLKVYIPPGTYQVNRHIIVDDVTIEGAGSWYTIIKGHEVALGHPGAGRLGAHRRRLLRQGRRRRRQHATCTCPASRSRATSASGSTPTRSTASAAR